jgi:hypothetical protein
MSTIRKDVAETTETFDEAGDGFDATSAFLSRLEGEKDDDDENLSGQSDEEDTTPENDPEGDDTNDEGSDESPETDDEDGEPGDDQEKKFADDDGVYVKITEGDKEHEVPLKDLKRLYGQEASLTRKSQEVADLRKTAETTQQKHVSALQVLIERAKQKAQPFRQIDWMAVSKDPNISQEEASALRTQAQQVLEEEAFLTNSLDAFMDEVNKQTQTRKIDEAKACVKALTTAGSDDKPNALHIEGWNDKVYSDVRDFGMKMGAPAEYVNTLTDPVAIKIMHMAMQFAKGANKVVTTQAVNKTPKKIVKTSSSPVVTRRDAPTNARKAAVKTLRNNPNKTGAAANAFYASFGVDDSD